MGPALAMFSPRVEQLWK